MFILTISFALGLTVSLKLSNKAVTRTPKLPKAIAHAFGGIEGATYTNSIEAFEHNFKKGCRYFEVDFSLTADQQVVAMHDGFEKHLGLEDNFSHQQFKQVKFDSKWTPVDAAGLAKLMLDKLDWYLVTDIKPDTTGGQSFQLQQICNELAKVGIDCRKRVIPQVYDDQEDFTSVANLGFNEIILTLYRVRLTDSEVFDFAKNNPKIVAVTMSTNRWNKTLANSLSKIGVLSYVHTVNDPQKISELLSQGVHGVYTDFACPK